VRVPFRHALRPTRRGAPREFLEEWRALLSARVVQWSLLDAAERARLEEIVLGLLTHPRWEAARGFALTDEIRVTIAAQGGLLALGLPGDPYARLGPIVVHPTTHVLRGPRAGPVRGVVDDGPLPILGQAHHRGPILIAWDAARAAARHPERGHNVVYHEFAHHLDMLDGLVDGTPPLPDAAALARWVDVCTAAYEALRRGEGGPLLDPYGAVNPGEFFAVATEVFFDRPIDLEDQHPDLYDVLAAFYRQDPAARARRAAGRVD
jgi:Mlc titration factor MtfA (ptsG expression regulator)